MDKNKLFFEDLNKYNVVSILKFLNKRKVLRTICKIKSYIMFSSYLYFKKYLTDFKGNQLYTLTGHEKSIKSLSFSPNGKYIVTGGADTYVIIWSTQTGELVRKLYSYMRSIDSFTFSSNGDYLATISNKLTVFNPNNGEVVFKAKEDGELVVSLAFSPDSNLFATGSYEGVVILWSIQKLNLLYKRTNHNDYVKCITFNNKGEYLASGSLDKTIIIWRTSNMECLFTLADHKQRISSLCFSNLKNYLVSGSYDTDMIVWDIEKGKNIRKLTEHKDIVWTIINHPNPKNSKTKKEIFASASFDKTIRLWEWDYEYDDDNKSKYIGNSIAILEGHEKAVKCIGFSPNGDYLASGSDDCMVIIWSGENGKLLQKLDGHTCRVESLCFSYDGKLLATGSSDNLCIIWN